MTKCKWALNSPSEEHYHDNEWGVPVHDDRHLFEFLLLEGAQAGLSWSTILNKREGYRQAFDNFDVRKVAHYDEAKIEDLINNSAIVRNRLKIKAAVTNAQAFIKVQEEFGSFDEYIWQFVDGQPIQNNWQEHRELPASTNLSVAFVSRTPTAHFTIAKSCACMAPIHATSSCADLNRVPANC